MIFANRGVINAYGAACLAAVMVFFALTRSSLAACSPEVDVLGERALAQQLAGLLKQQQIDARPAACQPARVEVVRTDQGVDVQVVDGLGRVSHRQLASVEQAAVWIESMLRPEARSLMPLPSGPAKPAEPALAVSASNGAVGRPPRRLSLTFGPSFGVGFDRTYLLGAVLTGCTLVGWMCVGASLRVWAKAADSGDSFVGTTDLTVVHIMALAEVRRWSRIAPYLGVGNSWARVQRTFHSETEQDDRGALRIEPGMSVSLPLTQKLYADARVFVGLQPLSSTATHFRGNVILAGDQLGDVGLSVSLGWWP